MPSRHAMHIIDHALTDQKRLVYVTVVQCPFWLLSSLHSSKRKMLKLAEHNEPDDFSVRLLVVSTSIRLIKSLVLNMRKYRMAGICLQYYVSKCVR